MGRKIQKGQKMFSVRFQRIKGLSLLGTRDVVFARNKEIARKKFLRNFVVSPKPKVTGVTEIK